MLNSIHVRPARAQDKESVLAFCSNTFSWGDYIANVWDDWLTYAGGQLWVATIAEQTAGIVHVALLDHHVAWMEGMRVNPVFRRRGVAHALDETARAFARQRGYRLARLATSVKNHAAQTLLEELGYQRVARFNEWETSPLPGDFSIWRVATENDLDQILAHWQSSTIAQASHAVVPNRYWRWTPMDVVRLRQEINLGQVRVMPTGFALLPAFDEGDWNGVSLHALAGDDDAMFAMAHAARAEAAYRGYAHVETMLVDYAPLNAALERAGYTTSSGMLLYEQEL